MIEMDFRLARRTSKSGCAVGVCLLAKPFMASHYGSGELRRNWTSCGFGGTNLPSVENRSSTS
jgi:hypothetical protein